MEKLKRRPELDEPELIISGRGTFPQQVGFENRLGGEFTMSHIQAIAQGLIGLHEVPEMAVTMEAQIHRKEREWLQKHP